MRKTKLLWRLSGWFLMAALFMGLGSGTLRAQTYTLVTDAATLNDGDQVLIVIPSGDKYYAMSTVVGGSEASPNRGHAEITVENDAIKDPTVATEAGQVNACVITLEKNEDGQYAFHDKASGKYLASVPGKNALGSSDGPCYFEIVSIAENGDVVAKEPINVRYLCYTTSFVAFNEEYYADKTAVRFYKTDPNAPYIKADETEVSYKIAPEANLNENLTFSAGNLTGDVTVSVASADEGRTDAVIAVNKTTLTATEANDGFELTLSTSGLALGTYSDKITLTSGSVTVEVTVNLTVRVPDVYQLVTKAARLKDGDAVLIVGAAGGDAYRVMGMQTMIEMNTGRPGLQVTVTDNAIVGPEIATDENDVKNACELTLMKNDAGKYAFRDAVAEKYLGTMGNRLNNSTGSSYFSITIDAETGEATIGTTSVSSTTPTSPFRYNAATNEFQAIAASAANNSVYIYKKRVPEIIVDETFSMTTVEGTPVSETLTVKGVKLENDVTVTCPDGNFSVSPATLDKEAVMSENGVELTVTFNAQKIADTVDLTLTSGDLTETITVTAMLKPDLTVDATLSMSTIEGISVSEKVVVKGTTLENDVTVSCPDGNFSVSPETLSKEDVMSENGAEFTVTFNGEKEADAVDLTLTSGDLTKTITVTATAEKPELTVVATLAMTTVEGTPVSEKVIVKGSALVNDVTVACPDSNFSVSPATLDKDAVMSENGAELTVTFNGEKEADTVDLTLTCGDLTKTITVTATATPKGNECEAPTNLNATVVDSLVTLTWEGEAEKYRVVVKLGKDMVFNELVVAKSHELSNLKAGIYSWSVASVCEDGEQAADGENFEVKKPVISANEGAEGLAFRIYPNPTTGAFYVEVAEDARMEIFTVGGVMIRNAELTAGKNEIRLDRSGIYFVRLTGAHGAAVNRVIVK